MSFKKTKLVVINEHTLGYQINKNTYGIIKASILKGSNYNPMSNVMTFPKDKVRLASEKDFNDFGVVFDGYKNDRFHEYQK